MRKTHLGIISVTSGKTSEGWCQREKDGIMPVCRNALSQESTYCSSTNKAVPTILDSLAYFSTGVRTILTFGWTVTEDGEVGYFNVV